MEMESLFQKIHAKLISQGILLRRGLLQPIPDSLCHLMVPFSLGISKSINGRYLQRTTLLRGPTNQPSILLPTGRPQRLLKERTDNFD